MAKIVKFHELGGPEVLKFEEIETPQPGKNEVTIKVKALGLNRAEALFRSGRYLEKAELPSRLGYEASGTIESIGEGVNGFKVGDVVSIIPPPSQNKYGVYGEVATVPANYVIKHPASLSYEEAAASWMQYLTGYGALIYVAKIQPGDFVLITAASSSAGLAAIQLCLLAGAIPIATTRSNEKKQKLLDAGAKFVIVTDEEDLTARINEITKGKGIRVAYDSVGGKGVAAIANSMTFHGIIIIFGALSKESTLFPLSVALMKCLTLRGYTLWELIKDEEALKIAVDYISNALDLKALKPIISKTFTLDQIVEAHSYLESNQQFGKIVVTVP